MRAKDQDHKDRKSGVIYSYKYDDTSCSEEYIGKSSRSLGERYKECLKGPSPIQAHI